MSAGLREKNRRETRQDLLEAAVSLVRELGYDQASVEAICERAGVSRATFFNYFPQKELLLTEVAATRLEQLRGFIAAQSEWQQPPTFEGLIELFGEFCRQNEILLQQAKSLFLRGIAHPACRERLAELRAEYLQAVATYLTPVLAARSPRMDPILVAETMFAVYMGSMLEWMITPAPEPGALPANVTRRLRLVLGMKEK